LAEVIHTAIAPVHSEGIKDRSCRDAPLLPVVEILSRCIAVDCPTMIMGGILRGTIRLDEVLKEHGGILPRLLRRLPEDHTTHHWVTEKNLKTIMNN